MSIWYLLILNSLRILFFAIIEFTPCGIFKIQTCWIPVNQLFNIIFLGKCVASMKTNRFATSWNLCDCLLLQLVLSARKTFQFKCCIIVDGNENKNKLFEQDLEWNAKFRWKWKSEMKIVVWIFEMKYFASLVFDNLVDDKKNYFERW